MALATPISDTYRFVRLLVLVERQEAGSGSRNAVRRHLIEALHYGLDPFEGFPGSLYAVDQQGWRSVHPYLVDSISAIRPKIVIEIGVWKGGSTIYMANCMKERRIEGAIISVDTWLGAVDHWMREDFHRELCFVHGYPSLYKKFVSNVFHTGNQDMVIPLPVDSLNASKLIHMKSIVADMIHIDAGHEYESVRSDLEAWWPVLREGGLLIGDDYEPGGGMFPGVTRAFDDFCASLHIDKPGSLDGKCMIRKSASIG